MKKLLFAIILLLAGCGPSAENAIGVVTRVTKATNVVNGSQSVTLEVSSSNTKFRTIFDSGSAAAINSSNLKAGDNVVFSATLGTMTKIELVTLDEKFTIVEGINEH